MSLYTAKIRNAQSKLLLLLLPLNPVPHLLCPIILTTLLTTYLHDFVETNNNTPDILFNLPIYIILYVGTDGGGLLGTDNEHVATIISTAPQLQ